MSRWLAQLLSIEPELFSFRVLDWNNAAGFDLLARDTTDLEFEDAAKFYVECKHLLTASFNHSLSNVRYIVCWDTDLENEGIVTAVGGDVRRMVIKPKTRDNPCTQFFHISLVRRYKDQPGINRRTGISTEASSDALATPTQSLPAI